MRHLWHSAKTVVILLVFGALASAGEAQPAAQQAEQPNVQAAQVELPPNPVQGGGRRLASEEIVVPAPPAIPLPPDVKVADVSVKGKIEGENITFALALSVESKRRRQEIALISGDVVLDAVTEPKKDCRLRYDPPSRTYFITHERSGSYKVEASFAARPALLGEGEHDGSPLRESAGWRQSRFSIPASLIRQLEVTCDRSDLEIQFPGALRLERDTKDGLLTITAILGPGRPFAVRWKPQISELDAKLVLACESNVIATAGVGALRLDTLFAFTITQGKLTELAFAVPKALSVTAVRGQHILAWRLDPDTDAAQKLVVILNRPCTEQYGLQVLAETPLPAFPTDVDLPVVAPVATAALPGGVRTAGHLAVGTNSAIHLLVKKTSGLSQIDASAFARILLDAEHDRPLPAAKAFCYTYASLPYQIAVSLSDITPSYDASESIVLSITEADLAIDASIDLDVRDAPIRSLTVDIPAGYAVADVAGSDVKKDDFTARPIASNAAMQEVEVHFAKPVQGRTLVRLRIELGKGPLGAEQQFGGFAVRDAKNERGYIAIVAEEGVQLDPPTQKGLRDVHVGSVPMKVANAQYAYRFREKGWSLAMNAQKKASGIRVEALHLVSLGEGVAYSAVTANYVISGAPVDRLHFRLPDGVETIEFVGRDVSIWEKEGEQWVVRLQRKVIGDYNLGVTYSQRYDDGSDIMVGGAQCEEVDTRTGYVVVAGHVNAKLTPKEAPGGNVIEIDRDEVPANYRLMVNAPILRTWKYVNAPHSVALTVNVYDPDQLLPVLIEVSEMNTTLSIRKDGETESVTRVRYKVKNSSSQFLMLSMPDGARVWTTHIIERDSTGAEKPVRVASSFDEKAGKLMIPLRRYRNPNEPVTVELEYGQAHGTLRWSGAFALAAPCSSVRSTFANWLVTAPKDWAVLPDPTRQDSMVADDRGAPDAGVLALAGNLLDGWEAALNKMLDEPEDVVLALIGVVGAIAAAMAIARYVPRLHPGIVLFALLLIVGIRAAAVLEFRTATQAVPDDFRSLRFTQVLNAGEQTPLAVSAFAVPAWRRAATLAGSVIVPLAGLACLVIGLGVMRGRPAARRAFVALGLACFACAAAQFPDALPALLHAFTWGIPAALVLWAAVAALVRRGHAPLPSPVVAMLLIAAVLAAGCSATRPAIAAPQPANPVLDHVECRLFAEKDSMAVSMHLQFEAAGPMRVPLVGTSAILLSPQKISDTVRTAIESGCYRLIVDKKGKYDVELKFLCPLEKAGDDQVRRFGIHMPPALTNRVELTVPQTGMQIEAPNAVRLIRDETADASIARAILGPGDDAIFLWKPRARQVKLEATSFYTEIVSLIKLDTGVAEGRHRIRFQIAQGELSEVKVNVPPNMTVTAVDAQGVGAWRFDPASHALEVKLAVPAHDDWLLTVITQSPANQELSISILTVEKAASQRGTTGVVASPAVSFVLKQKPQEMNVDDFMRDAAPLLAALPGIKPGDVRFAFRTNAPADVLAMEVSEVQPEIRSQESSTFSIADDRLVYNGELAIEIAKAGKFSIDLNLPAGYDIDALAAPEVSHWDDSTSNYGRTVQVHFRARIMGQVVIKLAMSRPESELPKDVNVPRVEVAGTIKHSGQIVISSDRGVRMSVAARNGVSELNSIEMGIRDQDSLAFKLLKSDWDLTVQTEVIKPRINVDFLHVARVTDGLVRHTHYLMYRLYNAGSKEFMFDVPKDAIGLVVTGPDIARREEIESAPGPADAGADPRVRPGQAQGPAPTVRWRVELAHKWFDRPYPLRIEYETRFDRAAGEVNLLPAKAITPDMQRGHVVVYATDRVELSMLAAGQMLQPADTRSLPGDFGAGDLSDAAFCYASSAADCELSFKATRHSQAALLEAEVLEAKLMTVVNELGDSINQLQMQLRVGSKRNLQAKLPPGAEVWSLLVNRRSVAPSRMTRAAAAGPVAAAPAPAAPDPAAADPAAAAGAAPAGQAAASGPPSPLSTLGEGAGGEGVPLSTLGEGAGGEEIVLIPLAQAVSGELPVSVDLVYVLPRTSATMNDGVRPLHGYAGPEFDLPLKNVQWNFLVPEGYDYSDFAGTLIVNEDLLDRPVVTEYDINAYESEVMQANVKDLRQAMELQTKGNELAQQGEQYQARQALERAYNYSFSDPALNEDTRVQLNNLIRQQAVVGLIGRRGRLRSEGKDPQPAAQGKAADLGDRFNTADAERLTNMLSKDDSENLERITTRLIQTQEAAAGTPIQLVINVPLRGRRLEFNRALQVNPNTPMNVSFTASRRTQARTWLGRLYACGIFLCLFAAASAGAWASRKRPPRPTATAEPPAIEPPPARSNDPEPPAPPAAEPMTDEGDSNEHDAPDESEPEASEEKREE